MNPRKMAYFVLPFALTVAGTLASPAAQAQSAMPGGPLALSRSASSAEGVLARIHEATAVVQGHGKHQLYIFIDPNCPYCHKVYMALQKRISTKDLKVHWIPVGFLTTTSEGKAAAILSAKDPRAALHHSETHYSRAAGGGAITETLASNQVAKQLETNLDLLKSAGKMVVPTILFRDKHGKAVVIPGAPEGAYFEQMLDAIK